NGDALRILLANNGSGSDELRVFEAAAARLSHTRSDVERARYVCFSCRRSVTARRQWILAARSWVVSVRTLRASIGERTGRNVCNVWLRGQDYGGAGRQFCGEGYQGCSHSSSIDAVSAAWRRLRSGSQSWYRLAVSASRCFKVGLCGRSAWRR